MNDLQSELSAFYRDCEQRLAVCEAATAGPWDNEGHTWIYAKVPNGRPNGEGIGTMRGQPHHGITKEQDTANATFIAASRNQRPGEIRALVKLAKALEKAAKEINDNMSECCSAGFYDPGWPDCDICTKCKEHSSPCFTEAAESAQAALREILADWRAGQ